MDDVNLRAADEMPDGTLVCRDDGRCCGIIGADGSSSERTERLSGRDVWLHRLEHMLDEEPEEFDEDAEPDEDEAEVAERELSGRDLWLQRLEEYR